MSKTQKATNCRRYLTQFYAKLQEYNRLEKDLNIEKFIQRRAQIFMRSVVKIYRLTDL
jgi:hypothetical protein